MKHDTRIRVHTFSNTFEQMCNFVAVARTGDTNATIAGLVKLCLLEVASEPFDTAAHFSSTIDALFGLSVPDEQIQACLHALERDGVIQRLGRSYQLSSDARASLRDAVSRAHSLEDFVRTTWCQELRATHPQLPCDLAWAVLRSYLAHTFRRHGLQAAALLDPSIETAPEHDSSLTQLLRMSIQEHSISDEPLRQEAEDAVGEFMAAGSADVSRAQYIAQLADGAFSFYSLEVPRDVSAKLRQNLRPLTLFLDTNFLFGILDLHHNSHVHVSHDLLNGIRQHKLPFKLRYHESTQREMEHTIAHYGSILRSRHWSQSLSRAASSSRRLSGIEQRFHSQNAEEAVDVREFLRKYEHFDTLLAGMDVKIYRPHATRFDLQNELFHDYSEFLANNGRADKAYETVMHDAKVLEEASHLRTGADSSLDAGALVISCDYLLYRFDWQTARKEGRRACVLLPNIFWQVLRPFIPRTQDFDKAFAETFALPEFRALGSGGARACSKMMQILASYKDVPESTATRLLANGVLLDKLRTASDESTFAQEVEAAFVEENRQLLEERAALEQAVNTHTSRADEEARAKEEARAELARVEQEATTALRSATEQLVDAGSSVQRHALAAEEAQAAASRARVEEAGARQRLTDEEAARRKAEREARVFRTLAAVVSGVIAGAACLAIARWLPWRWLVDHERSVQLHLLLFLMVAFPTAGFVKPRWRGWCWGVAGLSLLIAFLTTS